MKTPKIALHVGFDLREVLNQTYRLNLYSNLYYQIILSSLILKTAFHFILTNKVKILPRNNVMKVCNFYTFCFINNKTNLEHVTIEY